ncbi:response regulator [Candidatus Thorarchaeota archaeon]|nr:MAG: response regulator [Candidatus Thorarchaeota archaeon]
MLSGKRAKTVVIAGEIPFLRSLLKIAIEDEGFQVVGEASSGDELLEKCNEKTPANVILDLDLSEEEGLRLIESILDINSTITVIALSEPGRGLGETAFAAGARAILQKPFTTFDLVDTLRKVAPLK